jgi:hypothetical protein
VKDRPAVPALVGSGIDARDLPDAGIVVPPVPRATLSNVLVVKAFRKQLLLATSFRVPAIVSAHVL